MGVFWHRHIHIRSFLPSRRRPRRDGAPRWPLAPGRRRCRPPPCGSLHAMMNTVAQPQGGERGWPVENSVLDFDKRGVHGGPEARAPPRSAE